MPSVRWSWCAETPFFAVLGRQTFAWCEQLRDLLAERLGEHLVDAPAHLVLDVCG